MSTFIPHIATLVVAGAALRWLHLRRQRTIAKLTTEESLSNLLMEAAALREKRVGWNGSLLHFMKRGVPIQLAVSVMREAGMAPTLLGRVATITIVLCLVGAGMYLIWVLD